MHYFLNELRRHSRALYLTFVIVFSVQLTNSKYNSHDLTPTSDLELEATALPTVPQPLTI